MSFPTRPQPRDPVDPSTGDDPRTEEPGPAQSDHAGEEDAPQHDPKPDPDPNVDDTVEIPKQDES